MMLDNLRFGSLVTLPLTILIILVLALSLLGGTSLTGSEERFERTMTDSRWVGDAADAAQNAQTTFKKQVQEWKNVLLRGNDAKQFEKYLKKFNAKEAQVQEILKGLADTLEAHGEEAADIREVAAAHAGLGEKYRKALKSYDQSDQKSAFKVDRQVRGIDRVPTKKMDAIVARILTLAEHRMTQLSEENSDANRNMITFFTLIALAAILLGALLGFLSRGALLRKVGVLDEQAKLIASGDLTHLIDVPANPDAFQSIGGSINRMTSYLASIIRRFVLQSDTVAACVNQLVEVKATMGADAEQTQRLTQEALQGNVELGQSIANIEGSVGEANAKIDAISASTDQLSENINTIAAASEEASQNVTTMASAAEEMSSNVTGVNQSLEQVNSSVNNVSSAIEQMTASIGEVRKRCVAASRESEQANHHAQDAHGVMTTLASQAQEIGEVIGVIQNIADQTNMLALNAAIEAAGAGEAGKGFAVVAGEVKELARQTNEATLLIAEKIEEIQENTQEAAQANQEISNLVGHINEANTEITHAVDEQAASIQEITKAMDEVNLAADEVTRNAKELEDGSNEVARAASEAALGTSEIARSSAQAASSAQDVATQSQEVKSLAQTILSSAQETSHVSTQVQEKMAETADIANFMHGSVAHFGLLTDVVQGSAEALRAAQTGMNTGAKMFDMRLVKEAHLVWLGRLEQVIRGRIQLEESEVATHQECDFGKWYFGPEAEPFRNDPTFHNVGELHKQVHETAREAVRLSNAGETDAAIDMMGQFSNYRRDLFKALDDLFMGEADEGAERPLIEWSDDLDVGVAKMNEDHQVLIDLINQLHSAMVKGTGKQEMGGILDGLLDFTRTHFAREEGLMKKHGYQRLPNQKDYHEKLIAQVADIQSAFHEGTATVSLEVLDFLQDWLVKHIQGEDMQYKAFFREKGVT